MKIPGALNLGPPLATFTMQFSTLFANTAPIISGYYSATKLDKFKSIKLGVFIGILGHFILIISSIPSIMKFLYPSYFIILLSISLIAILAVYIKANTLTLLLDQYEYNLNRPDYKILPNNEKVEKINHKSTLEKLSMSFYMFINWGCVLSLIGSFMERYFGFLSVYL
jgi:dipeptide/tripeptide permease